MCLNSSRLLKSLWTPGIGIQNHLSGQLPWIRSWRNCDGAGKPSKTSSRGAPCRVHEKGGKNNSSRLGDTTLADQPVAGIHASVSMMTKGGLNTVTRSLAIEYAKDGIRFNAVAPGVVDSPLHKDDPRDSLKTFQPMGKIVEIEDVVDAVLY